MRCVLVALLGSAAFGCGQRPDVAGTDAAVDTRVNIANFTDTVTEMNGAPVAGATICLTGVTPAECATSAGNGTYTLRIAVPDGLTEVAGVMTANGYLGRESLFFEDPTAQDEYGVDWVVSGLPGLLPASDATTYLATQAGFTYPTATTGFVLVQVMGANATDNPAATATISAPGAAAVYVASGVPGTPDPTLTTTPTTSLGAILFGNLAPGKYTITVQSTGRTCTAFLHGGTFNGEWPPSTDGGTLSVGITPNVLTQGLDVMCL
jgi:hypothetical protein